MSKTANLLSQTTTPQTQKIASLEVAIARIRTEADRLADQLRMARGTREVAPAPQALVSRTLAERVERVLRGPAAPIAFGALVAATGSTAGRVTTELRRLRDAGLVRNAGDDLDPRWIWTIGDEGPTPELIDVLERLISFRPMIMSELVELTGARRNRISGALVKIQMRHRLANVGGTERTFRWFLKR